MVIQGFTLQLLNELSSFADNLLNCLEGRINSRSHFLQGQVGLDLTSYSCVTLKYAVLLYVHKVLLLYSFSGQGQQFARRRLWISWGRSEARMTSNEFCWLYLREDSVLELRWHNLDHITSQLIYSYVLDCRILFPDIRVCYKVLEIKNHALFNKLEKWLNMISHTFHPSHVSLIPVTLSILSHLKNNCEVSIDLHHSSGHGLSLIYCLCTLQ